MNIASGRRYLLLELVTGTVELSDGTGAFRRPGGAGLMQVVTVDLETIVERFENESPPRQVFTLSEIARMSVTKSPTVHSWVRAGVLTPSLRDRDGTRGRAMLFSRQDAFLACLVAALQRKCRLQLRMLRKVCEVLREVGWRQISPAEIGAARSGGDDFRPGGKTQ